MDLPGVIILDSHLQSGSKTPQKIAKNVNTSGNARDKENWEPNGNFVPAKQASTTLSHNITKKKKGLKVRFAPLPPGTSGMRKAVKKSEKKLDYTLNALLALISVWGKHHARTSIPKYIPRVAFSFQPGLTTDYMKYVCTLPFTACEDDFDGRLAPQTRAKFNKFIAEFSDYQQNVIIVTDESDEAAINSTTQASKSIVIFRTKQSPSDSVILKTLLASIKTQCLIVMAEPLFAFQIASIEKRLAIRVRQVVFPLLSEADSTRPNNNYVKGIFVSLGIPMLNKVMPRVEVRDEMVLQEFALWRRPEFSSIAPLYMHLFLYAKLGRQLYPNMAITLNSQMSILDAAATLGFTVLPAKLTRDSSSKESSEDDNSRSSSSSGTSDSDSSGGSSKESSEESSPSTPEDDTSVQDEDYDTSTKIGLTDLKSPLKGAQVPVRNNEPYVIKALPLLTKAFEQDFPAFSSFEVIQAHQQLWQEAERAIIRVMADDGTLGENMGQRWPFLSKSFIAEHQSCISRVPLVIPKVTKSSKTEISIEDMRSWLESGNTMFPVKKTMSKSCWATLLQEVPRNQGLYPLEKSKGPDYLVVFGKNDGTRNILCFQVKSGIQDLSIQQMKKEIGKCPFIEFKDGLFTWTGDNETTITFVYVAANHWQIKSSLKQFRGVEKSEVCYRISHVTQHFALPQSVEVVVLRQAGIQSLLGNDAYSRLLEDESLVSFAEAEKNIWNNLMERFRAKPKSTNDLKNVIEPTADLVDEIRTKLRDVLALASEEHEQMVRDEIEKKFNP